MTATPESLNQPGNLKRNYGGIVIQKTRNQIEIDRLRRDYLESLRSAEDRPG